MATKRDLIDWVAQALMHHGSKANLVEVARHIWTHRRHELESSGDLLYTWQYDMRWVANSLRRQGRMRPAEVSPRGVWELTSV